MANDDVIVVRRDFECGFCQYVKQDIYPGFIHVLPCSEHRPKGWQDGE